MSNIKNPYPGQEAKESLSQITNLTKKQIQNWFTNSRKRFLEPLKKKIDVKKRSDLESNITEKNLTSEESIPNVSHSTLEKEQQHQNLVQSEPISIQNI